MSRRQEGVADHAGRGPLGRGAATGLHPEVVTWLARGGLPVRAAGTTVQLLEFGVFPLYEVDLAADPVRVAWIPERTHKRVPRVAGSLPDVERWLMIEVAPNVLLAAGRWPERSPEPDVVADGFVLEEEEGEDLVVVDPRGTRRLRFIDGRRLLSSATLFTHVADLPVAAIAARVDRGSLRSP